MKNFLVAGLLLLPLLVWVGCSDDDTTIIQGQQPDNLRERYHLETLGPIPYPADNPPTQERIWLGKMLFFDPLLGGEKDVACATCHHPDFAFADNRQLPVGVAGTGIGATRFPGHSRVTNQPVGFTPRNAPTCFNTAYNADESTNATDQGFMFWDGRVKSLEVQATRPITSRVEMRGDAYPGSDAEAAAAAVDSVLNRLRGVDEYVHLFRMAFPVEADEWDHNTREHVIDSVTYGKAVAAYERELVTRNSAYDRYVDGDDNALTPRQKRGLELFFTKAKCAECHKGAMFSDFKFVVNGVPQEGPGKVVIPGDDVGRAEHTLLTSDYYAFRTPSLRNAELTAPYMHDGVFETLMDVVDFYNSGALPRHPACSNDRMDSTLVQPLGLTAAEKGELVEFLRSLTDPGTGLAPGLISIPARVPSGLTPIFGMGSGG